jgi:hypothetical protein
MISAAPRTKTTEENKVPTIPRTTPSATDEAVLAIREKSTIEQPEIKM